jgi:hypothetical protein
MSPRWATAMRADGTAAALASDLVADVRQATKLVTTGNASPKAKAKEFFFRMSRLHLVNEIV